MRNLNGKWMFRLNRPIWSNDIEFNMAMRDNNGTTSVARNVTMEIQTEETIGRLNPPFMSLPTEAAQALMDELWSVGLRPSEGTGSAGSLAATERHLTDMKTIAWHALKIDSKKGGSA